MTRFAFGGKFGKPASAGAARLLRSNSAPSAAMPIPVLVRLKNWRRVEEGLDGTNMLFLGHRFVEVEDRARHGGPRGEFRGCNRCVHRRFAGLQQIARGVGVARVYGEFPLRKVSENRELFLIRRPRGGELECERSP